MSPPRRQSSRKQIGNAGEQSAAKFLETQGYKIAAMNVRPMPGMARGEIDIIAWDADGTLCFVEVKTRRTSAVPPDLGVNPPKRRQLIALAEAYLSREQIDPERCRFDVVSVWCDPALPSPMLRLHKNAFGPE